MRVTKEQIQGALKLMGLEFTDPELDLMLPRVNQSLGTYESLRAVDIGYGVEPSFTFHPGLPDRKPIAGPQRFFSTLPANQTATKAPANLEDVAFWRVTELAPLIRSRAVSSTDLTKMYLARMKQYSVPSSSA